MGLIAPPPPDGLRAEGMRVLVIDPDPRAPPSSPEGLEGVQPLEVRRAATFDEREAAPSRADVVVIAADSPDRDTLESLREAGQEQPARRGDVRRPLRAWPGRAGRPGRGGGLCRRRPGAARGCARSSTWP